VLLSLYTSDESLVDSILGRKWFEIISTTSTSTIVARTWVEDRINDVWWTWIGAPIIRWPYFNWRFWVWPNLDRREVVCVHLRAA
jgi:hypothetical protein